jgi:phosphopantothenoylcysteine decarboxylase/phosphopantothenate--cysteine ligase
MNTNMWSQPVVQEHVTELEERGWIRIGPDEGALACGTEGAGRMSEPEDILATINRLLRTRHTLEGKRILILSGPTREPMDNVRYISNASSGKMGKALALAVSRRGADVDFVTGPVHETERPRNSKVQVYPVTTAAEMRDTAEPLFDKSAATLFVAAVADYAPTHPAKEKQPKSTDTLQVELEPTPDIAATLCAGKRADASRHGRRACPAKNGRQEFGRYRPESTGGDGGNDGGLPVSPKGQNLKRELGYFNKETMRGADRG